MPTRSKLELELLLMGWARDEETPFLTDCDRCRQVIRPGQPSIVHVSGVEVDTYWGFNGVTNARRCMECGAPGNIVPVEVDVWGRVSYL